MIWWRIAPFAVIALALMNDQRHRANIAAIETQLETAKAQYASCQVQNTACKMKGLIEYEIDTLDDSGLWDRASKWVHEE